jgi:hypothetical protein
MQLNDIRAFSADQDRGVWFDLADPVTGEPTGIRIKVAGPDSEIQNRARLRLSDDLSEAADAEGHVTAETRERLRLDSLARCVLDWEVSEEGQTVPLSHVNILRLLKAGMWVQAQVDAFASDRAAFRKSQ